MPQPRKYKTNAERQAAYRKRKAASASQERPNQAVVARVLAADAKAQS